MYGYHSKARAAALLLAVLSETSRALSEAPVCKANPEECAAQTNTASNLRKNAENNADTTTNDDDEPFICGLYLAPTLDSSGYSVYSGIDRDGGALLSDDNADLIIPIIDANKNDFSSWHDFVYSIDNLNGEFANDNKFISSLFMPGIASTASCWNEGANVQQAYHHYTDSSGVHRSKDAAAGSFAYTHNAKLKTRPSGLYAGEELFINCEYEIFNDNDQINDEDKVILDEEDLMESSVCIDTIKVTTSTIPGIGRGAFSRVAFGKDDLITVSPVLQLPRSDMDIVEQVYKENAKDHVSPSPREHGIEYTADNVKSLQLLLNYCYGRSDSDVLLLPIGPGVNFINHASGDKANVRLEWKSDTEQYDTWLSMSPQALFAEMNDKTLMVEYVAIRDIQVGEELFLDYGEEWQHFWDEHASTYKGTDTDYVSAADFMRKHENEPIRTVEEQSEQPYPSNIQTACFHFTHAQYDLGCWYPCDITGRNGGGTAVNDNDDDIEYSAHLYNIVNIGQSDVCAKLPPQGQFVTNLQVDQVKFIDKPYTTDVHLTNAFRKEIGVPDFFYPRHWLKADVQPDGDFDPSKLKPGQMSVIRWDDNKKVVTEHAYRLGLPSKVREVLLDYCDKMGITDILKTITIGGNTFEPDNDSYLDLHGLNWYLQRPSPEWRSNLHWLSPADNPAHEDYLQALNVAGFGDVLAEIGKQMGMDGIVAFHVTFIAVSWSTQGYVHYDVKETGAKTYNIIVPLILANETGPELDVVADSRIDPATGDLAVGRYRYEYDVASMMGDAAYHATSAVDYRSNKEFRMAATIYIADVNEKNVDSIMSDYTQAYPPKDRDMLLGWRARHWKKDDPSRQFPSPSEKHVLYDAAKTAAAAGSDPTSTL